MIVVWSNLFVLWSRIYGVPGTIARIRKTARRLRLRSGTLDDYSRRTDAWLDRAGFLFAGRRQRCLVRGLLLFFHGARLGLNVGLCFGSREKEGRLNTHCWIREDGRTRFEVEDVISRYVTLVEYGTED